MADLEGLIGRLIKNDVEFVLIGGFAAMAHGVTLLTKDVDVCCSFSPENLTRLQAALSDLNPVHRMTPRRLPLQITPANCHLWKNLNLDTEYGQLDCLSDVTGVGGFDEAKRDSVEIQLAQGRCRILSLDALIRAKKAAGRARDREAVLQLRAIRERLEQG